MYGPIAANIVVPQPVLALRKIRRVLNRADFVAYAFSIFFKTQIYEN